MRRIQRMLSCSLVMFAVGVSPVLARSPVPPPAAVRVDHHTHLDSPAIQSFIPEFCESIKRYGKCDDALTTPH